MKRLRCCCYCDIHRPQTPGNVKINFQWGRISLGSWTTLSRSCVSAAGMTSGQSEVRSLQNTNWQTFTSAAALEMELAHISFFLSLFFFFPCYCVTVYLHHRHTCVHTKPLGPFLSSRPEAEALSCKKVLLLSVLDIKIWNCRFFFFFFVRLFNNPLYILRQICM